MFTKILNPAQAADNTIKDAANTFSGLNQNKVDQIIGYWLGIFMWLVGIVTFVMVMYTAYLFMSAGADEANLKKAKAYLLWSAVGAVVLILSLSVIAFTKSFLE